MSNTNEITTAKALVEFGIGKEAGGYFFHREPVPTKYMQAEEFLSHPQTAIMAMAITTALVWKGGNFKVETECGRPGSFHCYVSRWAPDESETEDDYIIVCHSQSSIFTKVISTACCEAMLIKKVMKEQGEANDA